MVVIICITIIIIIILLTWPREYLCFRSWMSFVCARYLQRVWIFALNFTHTQQNIYAQINCKYMGNNRLKLIFSYYLSIFVRLHIGCRWCSWWWWYTGSTCLTRIEQINTITLNSQPTFAKEWWLSDASARSAVTAPAPAPPSRPWGAHAAARPDALQTGERPSTADSPCNAFAGHSRGVKSFHAFVLTIRTYWLDYHKRKCTEAVNCRRFAVNEKGFLSPFPFFSEH